VSKSIPALTLYFDWRGWRPSVLCRIYHRRFSFIFVSRSPITVMVLLCLPPSSRQEHNGTVSNPNILSYVRVNGMNGFCSRAVPRSSFDKLLTFSKWRCTVPIKTWQISFRTSSLIGQLHHRNQLLLCELSGFSDVIDSVAGSNLTVVAQLLKNPSAIHTARRLFSVSTTAGYRSLS
jgi:hypothetical protein